MYLRALTIKGDFGKAWSNLGVAYASTGKLDLAEEPFAKACQYEPENRKNWVNLARLHQAMGRGEAAAAAMARAKGFL